MQCIGRSNSSLLSSFRLYPSNPVYGLSYPHFSNAAFTPSDETPSLNQILNSGGRGWNGSRMEHPAIKVSASKNIAVCRLIAYLPVQRQVDKSEILQYLAKTSGNLDLAICYSNYEQSQAATSPP